MNKANKILFFTFILLFFSCSDNSKDAIKYNEKIVLSYQKVADIEEKLIFYLLADDTLHFNLEYEKFVKQIDLSEKEIKQIGTYNNYSDFYEAALDMILVYKEESCVKVKELMLLKNEEANLKENDSLSDKIDFGEGLKLYNNIMEIEFLKFDSAQQKFAERFNFKLM